MVAIRNPNHLGPRDPICAVHRGIRQATGRVERAKALYDKSATPLETHDREAGVAGSAAPLAFGAHAMADDRRRAEPAGHAAVRGRPTREIDDVEPPASGP